MILGGRMNKMPFNIKEDDELIWLSRCHTYLHEEAVTMKVVDIGIAISIVIIHPHPIFWKKRLNQGFIFCIIKAYIFFYNKTILIMPQSINNLSNIKMSSHGPV